MTKKLSTSKISNELKGSAWFRQPQNDTPLSTTKKKARPSKTKEQFKKDSSTAVQHDSSTAIQQGGNTAVQQAGITALLQFDDESLSLLKQTTYKKATFRYTDDEDERIKDMAYQLSKEVKKGKVHQADIFRIGLMLIHKIASTNKADLIKILEAMK